MKLKSQLIISIAIFGVILLIISASVIITNQQAVKITDEQQTAGQIQTGASNLAYISNDYFLYQDNAQVNQWQTQYSTMSADLSKINSANPEQAAQVNNVETDLQLADAGFNNSVTLVESTSQNGQVPTSLKTVSDQLAVENQALAYAAYLLANSFENQANQLKQTNNILIFTLLGAFAAYFVMIYLLVFRRTFRSIAKLQEGTKIIGSGNLDYTIASTSNDEVGELSQAFNQMTTNLKSVTASKSELENEIAERKKAEQEAARIASFPLLNPNPILEVDFNANITFSNPAAKTSFADLENLGSAHPFLFDWQNVVKDFEGKSSGTFSREVKVGEQWFDQQFYLVPNAQRIRIYTIDITERKKAEAQIIEQLHMFDLAHVIVKNMKDEIIFWNSGAQKLYGFSKDEATGKVPRDLLKTKFPKPVEEIKKDVFNNGEWDGELIHTKADGSTVVVASHWVLRKDQDNKPVAIIETNNDITEIKEAEQKLAKSEQRWSTTLSSIGDSVIATDVSGFVTFMNKVAEELTGWTLSESLGKPLRDVFHIINEETRGEVESPVAKVLEKGMIVGLANHTILVRKDGSEVPLDDSGAPIKDGKGNVTGVVLVFHDISERKEMEQKLAEYNARLENLVEERTKKLELSSLYARNLIEASLDPLITISREGKITDVNKATEDVTGCSREELVGSDFSDYFTEPEEARAGYQQVFTEGFVKDYPLSIKHKSGKITDVLYNASVYKNPQGEMEGVFAAARDITERKLAEKKLKDAERLANIGATAGMVGHDIRNPLQAITSDVYLAKTELASTPESQEKSNAIESLDEIQKNIDYVNKIVADLQDYARQLKPVSKETDLPKVVDEMLKKNVIPKNIKVQVKVQKEVSAIVADPDILKRILGNLVINAVQAMPEGGKLSINAFRKANDSIITVADTGVGIPDEIKDKLFIPLFTTKSKGQGFGLAVVKRMTESLGGTVYFESQEGKGTTFILRFPPAKS